jgi:uncharacterized protein with NAD-binding domain and iron-sulfur cluster
MPGKKVIILGGGVAGMSAAHELVERGFEVHVYERQALPGGKAREIPVPQEHDNGDSLAGKDCSYLSQYTASRAWAVSGYQPWLPGEHGFRFFPSFYQHVVDTMSRIPFGSGTVADNLTPTTSVLLSRFERPPIQLPARFPRTLAEFKILLDQFLSVIGGTAPIASDEIAFFSSRLWQIATSCRERRLGEYEKLPWWTFIDAEQKSYQYQRLLGYGITRSLVAAQADKASTRTIGDIFLQLLFGMADPAVASSDRVLNQPTNRAWIGPWLDYLRALGVHYHLETSVTAIRCFDGSIRSISVESSNGRRYTVSGDYYIAALPVERLAPLVDYALIGADPHLANLAALAENVEWMNGIQYYLRSDVPLIHGHLIFADSPWALTAISQAQFWTDVDLSQRGDGTIRGVLSVDISDWDTPGLNGKAAAVCTRQEIADEVWNQLKRSLNRPEAEVLRDDDLDFWFLDPDIEVHDRSRSTDIEPLLVNYADTWRLRPEAVTKIPNFFLASDYVRTYTDLATMEGANEAARRAVNGLLDAAYSSAPRCRLWNLYEPIVFAPLRAYDQARWSTGLPWDAQFVESMLAVLNTSSQLAKSASSDDILRLTRQFMSLTPVVEARRLPRVTILPR